MTGEEYQKHFDTVEALIDAEPRGLRHLLEVISEVCTEKAEHIRANWQDTGTADTWDKAATECDRLAGNQHVRALA